MDLFKNPHSTVTYGHLHSKHSLTALCIDECADIIASESDFFGARIGDILPGDICESLVHALLNKGLLNDETLHRVVSPFMSNLSIGKTKHTLSAESIDYALKMCRDLRRFQSYGHDMGSSTLEHIVNHSGWKALSLIGCPLSNTQFQDLIHNSAGLESLDISGNPHIKDFGIQSKKRKRVSDELAYPKRIKTETQWTPSSYATDNGSDMKLKHLRLSGCENLTDTGILSIALSCSQLEVLDISHCKNVTDISPILLNCLKIRELILDDCPIVTKSLNSSVPYLKHLKKFSFNGTGILHDGFQTWFTNCKSLEYLSLRNKTHIPSNIDESEKRSELFKELIQPLRHLQTLDLYGCNFTLSMINMLAQHKDLKKNLTLLDITCFDEISNTELLSTLSHPKTNPFERLHSLSIPGSKPESVDIQAEHIRRTFPCLESLCINKIKNYKGIRQVDLAKILTGFPHLKELKVWCCSSISYSLTAIVAHLVKPIQSVVLCAEDMGVHNHVDAEKSKEAQGDHMNFINEAQVERLMKDFPQIEFKIWRHSVRGSRNFQHINPKYPNIPETKIDVCKVSDSNQWTLKVDHIPIWANEKPVSLENLELTLAHLHHPQNSQGGTVPIVEDWCCSCNIDEFNGVLFYNDDSHIYWEVHEPGPIATYKFEKNQYQNAIESALKMGKGKTYCTSTSQTM